MSDLKLEDFDDAIDEEMTVTIDADDGCSYVCKIVTILEVNHKDYIVLNPLDNKGNETEDIWFYGYKENKKDPNEEPELIYIDNDDELDAVMDKFDEFLDDLEFDEN